MRTPHVNRSTKKIYSAAKIIIDKTEIFFCQTSWKDGLSKKIGMEYDLSCIIGKDDISFSRKYDLTPWTENERWSFSKKYVEMWWYFLQMFWKDGLFKNCAGIWSFLYYLERWYFFPKIWYFFLGKKMKEDLSQGIHGNMIFSVYTHRRHKHSTMPLLQKKSKMILPSKNASTSGWHSRLTSLKSSNISLYFYGGPCRRFHIFLSNEKTGNLICRTEVWLLP